MQDWVANITVLFSHCFKKKGTLQGSINREIRTLSCDTTVQVFNFVLLNLTLESTVNSFYLYIILKNVFIHSEKDL